MAGGGGFRWKCLCNFFPGSPICYSVHLFIFQEHPSAAKVQRTYSAEAAGKKNSDSTWACVWERRGPTPQKLQKKKEPPSTGKENTQTPSQATFRPATSPSVSDAYQLRKEEDGSGGKTLPQESGGLSGRGEGGFGRGVWLRRQKR